MLYQFYETQRALLAPFSEFASASAKLYSHPLSPFAHAPHGAARVGRVRPAAPAGQGIREARVRHHLGARSTASTSRCRSRSRSTSRSAACCASSASPTTCRADAMKDQPTVLVVAPLSGHHSTLLRDTVASLLQRPQGLHHRLDRRAHGAGRGRPVPPRRLRRLRAGVHPPHRPGRERDLGLPADGAGAGGGVADGEPRRAHAAHDDDDGRPDRRPQEPDGGQQPGDEQEPRAGSRTT